MKIEKISSKTIYKLELEEEEFDSLIKCLIQSASGLDEYDSHVKLSKELYGKIICQLNKQQ